VVNWCVLELLMEPPPEPCGVEMVKVHNHLAHLPLNIATERRRQQHSLIRHK
jgi:hypothetical protein